MKLAMLLVVLAACDIDVDPRWQLRHDRIIAIRTTPAAIGPGNTAVIDAFVTTVDGVPSVVAPADVSLIGDGATIAHDDRGWTITASTNLDGSGAPSVDLLATFDVGGTTLQGTKTVRLDADHDNPVVGDVTVDGVPIVDGLAITPIVDHPIAIDAASDITVRWLTGCGSLNSDDNEHAAILSIDDGDATSGELAVVVRDSLFGVAWSTWHLAAP